MATTLVGIFDDYNTAQQVAQELVERGFNQADINITANDAKQGSTHYGGGTDATYNTAGSTFSDRISNFFGNLFGSDVDESDRGIYAESVRRGSTLVTVRAKDQMVDTAVGIMNRHGAVDIDWRAAQYQASGYTSFDAAAPAYTADQVRQERDRLSNQGEVAMPVVEEQLQVGKRAVQRGGVRVYTRVTERPVEETINLREEQVRVDRRPVDRAVSEADLAAVREGAVEVTTPGEEAVVSKQARVVEEVVVGKEATERTETVHGTVQRTDVEVEQVDADTTYDTKSRSRGR